MTQNISQNSITNPCHNNKAHQITPTKPKANMIWMNGQFISWEEGQIHVLSHGLHYASAVFEGERAYNGKVFKLKEHNERLHRSAEMLGFQIPYSVDELNEITQLILEKNNLKNAYVRPIAWCGSETLSVASRACRVHIAIAAWEWQSYFSNNNLFSEGLKLAWADWIRPDPSTAPVQAKASGLYMIGSLSKNKAEQAGYHDALMLDYRGYVAECTGANFFMVQNNEIHTPIADCFLNGITRQTVIEIAKNKNFKVIERHILPSEIENAEEIFITGSAVEIAPVGYIGEKKYPIGSITKIIADEYAKTVLS